MLAADHISAVKRSFESRAMPETEKPPARLVDIYLKVVFHEIICIVEANRLDFLLVKTMLL